MRFCCKVKADKVKFVLTMWPVGQVVKTAASHAVNIGSNPVRVTSFVQVFEKSLTKGEENFIICLFSGKTDNDSWC